jgi:hypothetical protein
MTWLILLHFVNLFFAGMLAGVETAVHYGLGAPPKALSEQSQIQLRQVLVLKLRVLVPVFFVPTLSSAIAVAAIDGSGPGLWLRYTGLLALLIWIVIRVIRTVPINSATLGGAAKGLESTSRSLGAFPCSRRVGLCNNVCLLHGCDGSRSIEPQVRCGLMSTRRRND